MKNFRLLIVLLGILMNYSCQSSSGKGTMVLIETDFGNMKVRLFDETPQHRDNFIKLAREGYYDGLLFHRVINHFMIQGGDPNSKNAQPGQRLGNGDPGYTIPAEILPQFFHKKGMLAAARQPDQMNPEKRSSGSQFYIVQGKIFRPSELDSLESKLNISRENAMMQAMMGKAQTELNQLRAEGKQEEFMSRIAEIRETALNETAKLAPFKFTPEQKKAYTTIGGYPSLDGNYTIFGEVVEGLDVLDKIAAQQTGQFDRPVNDIHFNVKVLEK